MDAGLCGDGWSLCWFHSHVCPQLHTTAEKAARETARLIGVFRPRRRWLQAQLFCPLRRQLAISRGLSFQLSPEFRIFLISRHALELERVLEIFRDHFHSFGPSCTGMVGFTVRDLPAKKRVKSERAKPGWTTSYPMLPARWRSMTNTSWFKSFSAFIDASSGHAKRSDDALP